MKHLLLLVGLFFTTLSFSQSIKGTILDGELNDTPLSFAHISVQGTTIETLTDFDGSFEITNLPQGKHILFIQFLGYEPIKKEIEISSKETHRVSETLFSVSLK